MPSTGIETVMASLPGRRLMRKNKQELIQMCEVLGAKGSRSMTKAEMAFLLLEAGKKGKKENEEGSDIYWK